MEKFVGEPVFELLLREVGWIILDEVAAAPGPGFPTGFKRAWIGPSKLPRKFS